MKQNNKKIFLILVLSFVLIGFMGFVLADEGCCVTPNSPSLGPYCSMQEQSDCASVSDGFDPDVTNCDDAHYSECEKGACEDYENFDCRSGSSKIYCDESIDPLVRFSPGKSCDEISEWQDVCCVLNEGATSWESRYQCEFGHGSLPTGVNEDITTYNGCEELEDEALWGACVLRPGECKHMFGKECNDQANLEFSAGVFCSSLNGQYGINYEAGDSKQCWNDEGGDNDLYNYDDHDNRENLVGCGRW